MCAVKACFVSVVLINLFGVVLINLFGKSYLADSRCKPITDFNGGEAKAFGTYYYYYQCYEGYKLEPADRVYSQCNADSLVWEPDPPKCLLIRCMSLPHPENGLRTDANNGAGETTRFSCNPGYTLKGPSQLICRTDGEWSPSYAPKCEPILCPELSAPRNGDIFQDTSDGVRNNYGSIAQYTCNNGYTIHGTKLRQINRRCQADGTWDGYNYFCVGGVEYCVNLTIYETKIIGPVSDKKDP